MVTCFNFRKSPHEGMTQVHGLINSIRSIVEQCV
jgi:hypothetical protein